jgi:adenylate kinase family enzyme
MRPDSLIICGFPGVGKTTAAANRSDIEDAESSAFHWLWDAATGERNPNPKFPENYVDYLVRQLASHEPPFVILASCHETVRKELARRKLPYLIVAPEEDAKDEYLARYLRRGDPLEFIRMMDVNWREFMTSVWLDKATDIRLRPGQVLADILPRR